ncbi:MAG: GNAT family N-acetyltransferase, partial [Desulfobacterales bacterium]|nr:GNAT family N-acetyltransferase [Desulfobacterales bacterium]
GVSSMIRTYGLVDGAFRLAGLTALYHDTVPGEAYVDGVAVAGGFRGMGIGSGLLAALEKRAYGRGMERLTLEVIDSNPRAHALYLRLGFRDVSNSNLWPVNKIFGFPFDRTTLMEKRLDSGA